ncbi:MAG: ABC transporter permease [Gemmatimonadota bacterium]|jgi:predicted permease
MKALVRWLLARRLGREEAERFFEELNELHLLKEQSEGTGAGDRWLRKELRQALISGFGGRVRVDAPGDVSLRRGSGSAPSSLLRDVRFGLRTLRKRPLFTVLVVGTLGLGIGASTTVFSLVDGILLKDMAYEDPDELVLIWGTWPGWREDPLLSEAWDKIGLTWEGYATLREENRTFSDVAGHRSGTLTLTGVGDPVRLESGEATSSLFPLLGIRPVLGRTFLPGEDGPGAPRLAVIGYDLWQTRFGSDPGVLGRAVSLDGEPFEIIGVLPEGVRVHSTLYNLFNSAIDVGDREVWVPVQWNRQADNGSRDLEAVGRILPGVSRDQALAEVTGILGPSPRHEDTVFRLTPPREEVVAGHRSPLVLLLFSSGLLLLIACGNAATLLLGEAIDRRVEISTRVAMGASRRRIGQQLLTESLILGLAGSLVGMALTPLGVRAFLALGPALPRLQNVEVNQNVLLVAVLAGVVCALVFGFAPAVFQHKHSIHAVLQRGGRGRVGGGRRTQSALVAGELALTMVLLVSAGILGRSLNELRRVDPGFEAEGVATIRAQVSSRLLGDDADSRLSAAQEFRRAVLGRVEAIPGVVAFGAIDGLPFPGLISGTTFQVEGGGIDEPVPVTAREHKASTGYFEAMGIPLLAGEIFQDGSGAPSSGPVALINETMARRFWPDASPLGATVSEGGTAHRIVGIVGDVRERHLTEEPFPMVYRPLSDHLGAVSIVARGRGPAQDLVPRLREALRSANSTIPLAQETTMEALVMESAGAERFRTLLITTFGLLATFLALVGVFGVTARSVAYRNREMGIRKALGAENGGLIGMMALGTLRAGALGMVVGLMGALATARFLSAFVFGTGAFDLQTYLGAMLLMGTLCVLAAVLAARRVTRVEPMRVLREE